MIMKNKLLIAMAILLLNFSSTIALLAQGTAFTYQGNLDSSNAPANGNYDLLFTLYSTNSGGDAIAGPITNSATFVTNGLFTAVIDFGTGVFNGNPRWLEIGVQTNGGAAFTTLTPRQQLTATPYAVLAGDVTTANIARINATNVTQQATAVPEINSGFITSVDITSGGAGYSTAPTVTASDTNGSGAVLTATVSGGQVIGIAVSNPGSGYGSNTTTIVIGAPSGINSQTFGGINNFNNPSNTFSGNGSNLTALNPASLGGGTVTSTINFTGVSNSFAGIFTGNGAGLTNVSAISLNGLSAAAFWTTNGTSGANPTNGAYLGTADDLPLEIRVDGIRALRLEPTTSSANIIGGYVVNAAATNTYGVTIAGGGAPNYPNLATASLASVLGGGGNTAGGIGASVTGIDNRATNACALAAGTNSVAGGIAAIAIGNSTTASGDYSSALGSNTRAVGIAAQASGTNSFAGGAAANAWGNNSTASGDFSTAWGNGSQATNAQATAFGFYTVAGGSNSVAMGFGSRATGDYSFAAGYDAQATNTGAFVWADSSVPTPVGSSSPASVTFRASGGYRLFSNPTLTAGVSLASNGVSWATISDKNAKKNFTSINSLEILKKLAAIPVEKWNYKWEADDSTPNIGPMAQDFVQAFYPGRDDKHITTLEFDGVELAAIQGLNQKLSDELQHKEKEIGELKTENDSLEQRLERLEKMMNERNVPSPQ
jgi:hypothetical protein